MAQIQSMSGKKTGLQRQIRFYSLFSMYINCKNHCPSQAIIETVLLMSVFEQRLNFEML